MLTNNSRWDEPTDFALHRLPMLLSLPDQLPLPRIAELWAGELRQAADSVLRELWAAFLRGELCPDEGVLLPATGEHGPELVRYHRLELVACLETARPHEEGPWGWPYPDYEIYQATTEADCVRAADTIEEFLKDLRRHLPKCVNRDAAITRGDLFSFCERRSLPSPGFWGGKPVPGTTSQAATSRRGRKPGRETPKQDVVKCFLDRCAKGLVDFDQPLKTAAKDLLPLFPDYDVDTLRKHIQDAFREQERHRS